MAPGPLEEEIHNMTRVELPEGSMSTSELVLALMRNVEALNNAVERLAAEIDRLRESSSGPT